MAGIPILQVRGSSCCIYDEPINPPRYSKLNFRVQNMTRVRQQRYTGRVTAGVKKRLSKAVCLMCQSIKPRWITNPVTGRMHLHRAAFITLTVSSDRNITAQQGYALLLSHFLDWLTRTKEVKCYVWKAELQRRGQLHYHLTVPDFIHMHEIRKVWNNLQRKAGLLDDWFKKHGHYHPPSTDVGKVDHVSNLEFYLVKELCKTIDARRLYVNRVVDSLIKAGELPAEQKEKFVDEYLGEEMHTEGRIWGCSANLSKARYWNTVLTRDHEQKLETWIATGKVKYFHKDFFAMMIFREGEARELLNPSENKILDSHVLAILDG